MLNASNFRVLFVDNGRNVGRHGGDQSSDENSLEKVGGAVADCGGREKNRGQTLDGLHHGLVTTTGITKCVREDAV